MERHERPPVHAEALRCLYETLRHGARGGGINRMACIDRRGVVPAAHHLRQRPVAPFIADEELPPQVHGDCARGGHRRFPRGARYGRPVELTRILDGLSDFRDRDHPANASRGFQLFRFFHRSPLLLWRIRDGRAGILWRNTRCFSSRAQWARLFTTISTRNPRLLASCTKLRKKRVRYSTKTNVLNRALVAFKEVAAMLRSGKLLLGSNRRASDMKLQESSDRVVGWRAKWGEIISIFAEQTIDSQCPKRKRPPSRRPLVYRACVPHIVHGISSAIHLIPTY